ncbi:carboxymuconolactone decarboxylase family protein [Streptomyces sp. YS-3]|uniref:carboxymuconolactone decarboxylase family protein n=1 Tax=Streptomyces sp. YS-3 TaxID=3381352 RepID=UPI003862CE3C
MEGTVRHLGHLSPAVARMAASPHTLEGFLRMSALFESTTLDPLAREVVIMTVATRNGCALCVDMHTGKLRGLGAPEELIGRLREGKPLPDERLDAVREFTLAVYATAGEVPDAGLEAFLAHGHTPQNALEVVLGIGTYTVSTFANRLTGASH